MNRVPRGFNSLAERKAKEAADVIRQSVVPIFKANTEGKPVFEGTGVLVRVEGLDLLASAAHVFDEMRDGGVHLLLEGRETRALSEPMRLTLGARPERLSDTIDVGFVRLSAEEADAVGRTNFVEVRPRLLHSDIRWHLRYAKELKHSKYRVAGVSETVNIAIDFDHRSIVGPRGRGGRPNFIGRIARATVNLQRVSKHKGLLRQTRVRGRVGTGAKRRQVSRRSYHGFLGGRV